MTADLLEPSTICKQDLWSSARVAVGSSDTSLTDDSFFQMPQFDQISKSVPKDGTEKRDTPDLKCHSRSAEKHHKKATGEI